MPATSLPGQEGIQNICSASVERQTTAPENTAQIPDPIPDRRFDPEHPSGGWPCPIHSEPHRRGILEMTAADYLDLVDRSGRMMRSDKQRTIDAALAPILIRIRANPDAWLETISRFGFRFRIAAGRVPNLRAFADSLGMRWLQGAATARATFVSLLCPSA